MKYYLCLLLFTTSIVFSQNNLTNKEFTALQDKVRLLFNKDIDSGFIIANKIEKSNNFIHKAFAKGTKCYLYQLINDKKNSKKNYSESLILINKSPNSIEKTKNKAYLYNYGGLSDWLRGELSEALIKYQKGERLSIEVNDIVQIVKFNSNIALINGDIGNYKTAIKKSLSSENLIEQNKELYTVDQYNLNKSNIYLSLGAFYETKFKNEAKKNKQLLDSALYFYKKTTIFSNKNIKNRVSSQLNMANILLYKNQFNESEKAYQNVLTEAKENNLKKENSVAIYNLGYLYYLQKNYSKALVYLEKTDSLFGIDKANINDFINSNYFQSKIYDNLSDYENTIKHANICLKYFEINEKNMINQSQEINLIQNGITLKKEVETIKKKYSTSVFFKKMIFYCLGLAIVILIFFYFKKSRENKIAIVKYNSIINQYQEKITGNVNLEKEDKIFKANLNLDEEKENLLFDKLIKLEKQKVFLNNDFTLQFVAKKIKTNTTYLSYIVNKRFGKSFSEYVNELKIDYVINEMITNNSYRKYSTQAIAESVGYKNATSFTKSFNKKTGLSPVKFAEKLNANQINANQIND